MAYCKLCVGVNNEICAKYLESSNKYLNNLCTECFHDRAAHCLNELPTKRKPKKYKKPVKKKVSKPRIFIERNHQDREEESSHQKEDKVKRLERLKKEMSNLEEELFGSPPKNNKNANQELLKNDSKLERASKKFSSTRTPETARLHKKDVDITNSDVFEDILPRSSKIITPTGSNVNSEESPTSNEERQSKRSPKIDRKEENPSTPTNEHSSTKSSQRSSVSGRFMKSNILSPSSPITPESKLRSDDSHEDSSSPSSIERKKRKSKLIKKVLIKKGSKKNFPQSTHSMNSLPTLRGIKHSTKDIKAAILIQKKVRGFICKSKYIKIRARFRTINEIVSSEQKYTEDLGIVVKHFLIPLTESLESKKPLLSQKDINSIFVNIDSLYVAQKMFYSKLHRRAATLWSAQNIADVYLDFADLSEYYEEFIVKYKGDKIIGDEMEKKTPFASFIHVKNFFFFFINFFFFFFY